MKHIFALLVVVHGVIHLMGPAKAFGLAALPQLTTPISRAMAVLWTLAAVLLLATAAALYLQPRWWWAVGLVAVAMSQVVIATSWNDAKVGTVANGIILAGVLLGFLSQGPFSLRAEYRKAVASELSRSGASSLVTEADLQHLPLIVRKYVQRSGAVGQPRVHNYRVRFRGRIRGAPTARWMPFTADQVSSVDEFSRLFIMDATMFQVPMQALHMYLGPAATMRVKVASLVTVADARGPDMDRAETVTLLNDLCLLAPAALITRRIRWEELNANTVKAHFTNAGHAVSADLIFNDAGELTNFVSDDRLRSSPDGKTLTRTRWSTPLSEYRSFGPHRIMTRGEARWHGSDGEFAYGIFELQSIEYNVRERPDG